MTNIQTNTTEKKTLASRLLKCSEQQFTGRLKVAGTTQEWSLFFCLGRLVWATGGLHSNRRFYRLWHQFCPKVCLTSIKLREDDFVVCYNYQIMAVLSIRQKLTPQQKLDMVLETLKEVIFDIFQAEKKEDLNYTSDSDGAIDTSLTLMSALVRVKQVLPLVELLWSDWQKSGLATVSPNFVPILTKLDELKKITSPKAYQTLVKAIDGERTLRDLAVLIKQDLPKLTLYLIPYIRKDIINLRLLPDKEKLENAAKITSNSSTPREKETVEKPTVTPSIKGTIVCVDDSPLICQQMQKIIEEAGYKFIGIEDSIQALPKLIEIRPNLIFLDLVMPIANGYEICTQIRRVSWLKEIPVIILTGNDGILDRVHAKMVGSSDFLAKPVNAEQVLAAINKYLELPAPKPQKLALQTLDVQMS